MVPYKNAVNRIRRWGHLPRRRGATLLITNHQHDLEAEAIIMWVSFEGPWRDPIFAASGRRMFEPGFMAERLAWLAPLLRRFDATALFHGLGLYPIENELGSRPLSSFAWSVRQRRGNLPLAAVFAQPALARAGLSGETLTDLLDGRIFRAGRTYASMAEIHEPYRNDVRIETRARLNADLTALERLVASGATFFLTPEGRYTRDGRMNRFRTAFYRLAPLADIYIAPCSYDVFRGRRLSLLYRIIGPVSQAAARDRLAAGRPVTTSQLMAEFVSARRDGFSEPDAVAAVAARLATLPPTLFVDPELSANPLAVVREALAKMTRIGLLVRAGSTYRVGTRRVHPNFPLTADMLAFQAVFLAETLAADDRIRNPLPLVGGGVG